MTWKEKQQDNSASMSAFTLSFNEKSAGKNVDDQSLYLIHL